MTWDSMAMPNKNGLVKQTSKSNSQQDSTKQQVKIMTWDSMAMPNKTV